MQQARLVLALILLIDLSLFNMISRSYFKMLITLHVPRKVTHNKMRRLQPNFLKYMYCSLEQIKMNIINNSFWCYARNTSLPFPKVTAVTFILF